MPLVKLEIVITLKQLIIELDEGKPALKPLLVSLEGEHFVHAKARADVTQEVDVVEVGQPVLVVVRKSRLSVEADEAVKMRLDCLDIFINLLVRNHLTHFGFAGRISDSGSAAANQSDTDMAEFAQMAEGKKGNHVTDMEAGSRWVTADLKSNRFLVHQIRKPLFISALGKKSAFFQYFKCFVHFIFPYFLSARYIFENQRKVSTEIEDFPIKSLIEHSQHVPILAEIRILFNNM